MIPDKIYIHIGPHLGLMQANKIPVCAPDEKEFVRKDSLLEWAKAKHMELDPPQNERDFGRIEAVEELIDKLNSL